MDGAAKGDGDPLDICVVSERPITRPEVIVNARVIGGLPMIDNGEADDKIIAVLANDQLYHSVADLSDLPPILTERMRHYFSTYKLTPGNEKAVHIGDAYGSEHAYAVIEASMADYNEAFGE
jgi:inorganic pyrophosphatase